MNRKQIPLAYALYGGVLSINWLAQLTIPVTNGIMPQGAVSYQFDQYQICSASAWSQFAQANVTASSDQQPTSADASESGVNRFPDVDDPAAVTASVGDSWTMPALVVEGAVWMSPLQTVLTTTDTSSTNVTPNGGSGSGTSASAKTFTSINFNQSGAKGVGGNSIHITSGDGSPS